MMGQVPILRSIQYVTFKYGDFQKASRISLREPSISIISIKSTKQWKKLKLKIAQKKAQPDPKKKSYEGGDHYNDK